MKTMRLSLLSLCALVLLVGFVANADAVIRVEATVRTPNVRVRVGNMPVSHDGRQTKRHLPVREQRYYKISQQDRMIASRLAYYTGVPTRELIQLKRQGYSWFEIGRWLYVPRPVVRAAMQQRSWKRFLDQERRFVKHGKHPRERFQVGYLTVDLSSDDD
jgi:hypothetical protein